MIKECALITKNYKITFEDGQVKAANLNTGEIFGEEYFMSIETNKAKEQDFNLLLNTYGLLEQIPRKHMTNVMKKRLNDLHSHLDNLLDICMDRI